MGFRERGNGHGLPSLVFSMFFLIYVVDMTIEIFTRKLNTLTGQSSFIMVRPFNSMSSYFMDALDPFIEMLHNPFSSYTLVFVGVSMFNLYLYLKYGRRRRWV